MYVHLNLNFRPNDVYSADGVRAGAKRLGRKKELPDHKKDLCLQHTLNGRP